MGWGGGGKGGDSDDGGLMNMLTDPCQDVATLQRSERTNIGWRAGRHQSQRIEPALAMTSGR